MRRSVPGGSSTKSVPATPASSLPASNSTETTWAPGARYGRKSIYCGTAVRAPRPTSTPFTRAVQAGGRPVRKGQAALGSPASVRRFWIRTVPPGGGSAPTHTLPVHAGSGSGGFARPIKRAPHFSGGSAVSNQEGALNGLSGPPDPRPEPERKGVGPKEAAGLHTRRPPTGRPRPVRSPKRVRCSRQTRPGPPPAESGTLAARHPALRSESSSRGGERNAPPTGSGPPTRRLDPSPLKPAASLPSTSRLLGSASRYSLASDSKGTTSLVSTSHRKTRALSSAATGATAGSSMRLSSSIGSVSRS